MGFGSIFDIKRTIKLGAFLVYVVVGVKVAQGTIILE